MNQQEIRVKSLALAMEAERLADAGEYEGAQAYAAVAHAYAVIAPSWPDTPTEVPEQRETAPPLPDWCGECGGPEPGRRMVDVQVPEGDRPQVKWCPQCEPRSPEYQAVHQEAAGA